MVLEDEEGGEFDAVYIGNRTGLSGGWRGFAMHHNLEDGDSLVFELVEPDRFKVLYRVKFSTLQCSIDVLRLIMKKNFVVYNSSCLK
jgi:hypothetical protein